ncbi:hypothetical protein C0J52_13461 [Blattella germanica]|nr:hypothetical protein C0J52_13461 [Blattella germanica]
MFHFFQENSLELKTKKFWVFYAFRNTKGELTQHLPLSLPYGISERVHFWADGTLSRQLRKVLWGRSYRRFLSRTTRYAPSYKRMKKT